MNEERTKFKIPFEFHDCTNNILVIGSSGSGKSSLLMKLTGNCNESSPTHSTLHVINNCIFQTCDNLQTLIEIADKGNSTGYLKQINLYKLSITAIRGYIIVLDGTQEPNNRILQTIRNFKEPKGTRIAIVINKTDLFGHLSVENFTKKLELHKYFENYKWDIFTCNLYYDFEGFIGAISFVNKIDNSGRAKSARK